MVPYICRKMMPCWNCWPDSQVQSWQRGTAVRIALLRIVELCTCDIIIISSLLFLFYSVTTSQILYSWQSTKACHNTFTLLVPLSNTLIARRVGPLDLELNDEVIPQVHQERMHDFCETRLHNSKDLEESCFSNVRSLWVEMSTATAASK